MQNTQYVNELKKFGTLSEKASQQIIYFYDLDKWAGLQCSYYNTGFICAAKLNGQKIDNIQARSFIESLSEAQLWYDIGSGKFKYKGLANDVAQTIIDAISNRVNGKVCVA